MRSVFVQFLICSIFSFLLISCASNRDLSLGVGSKKEFEGGAIQIFEAEPQKRGKAPLVFVHGSPGRAEHWKGYLEDPDLGERFHLIAYDRPGYGQSSSGFVDFDGQVRALGMILEQQSSPATLVGHSLGGAIVLAAAARYPERVRAIVALAPSADPEPGFVLKLNRFLRCSGLGSFMLPPWRVSHLEILAVYPALRELQPELGKITAPVTIVQGGRDQLVPATSIPYLEENLTATSPEVVLLENEGHFIPWTKDELVKGILLGEKVVKVEK